MPAGADTRAIAEARLLAGLADLWHRRRADLLATAEVLVEALEDASTSEALDAAVDAAHRLAGTLGLFGLGRASDLAAGIEHELRTDRAAASGDERDLAGRARSIRSAISSHRMGQDAALS